MKLLAKLLAEIRRQTMLAIQPGQRRCALCLDLYTPEKDSSMPTHLLCQSCASGIRPYTGARCLHCGNPLHFISASSPADEWLCPGCARQPGFWDDCRFYGLYEGKLRRAILRYKFGVQLSYVPFLCDLLLYAACGLAAPDYVVPIPQHPGQLRKRGFNQAHELARWLCKKTGLRFAPRTLARTRAGKRQEELDARGRRENMAGAFHAPVELRHRHIWLVDDVMTTGSTFAAASEALRKAGAGRISLLCLARTPVHESDSLTLRQGGFQSCNILVR